MQFQSYSPGSQDLRAVADSDLRFGMCEMLYLLLSGLLQETEGRFECVLKSPCPFLREQNYVALD